MARLARGTSNNPGWIVNLLLAGLAVLVASCATEPWPRPRPSAPQTPSPPVVTTPTQQEPTVGAIPEHMRGQEPVRVALLLPLSAQNKEIKTGCQRPS